MKHTGVRKIKNGRVKFLNKTYRPCDQHFVYNGELDNSKWFFMDYPDDVHGIFMWGDEKRYLASKTGDEAYNIDCDNRREANINHDNFIMWSFWVECGYEHLYPNML